MRMQHIAGAVALTLMLAGGAAAAQIPRVSGSTGTLNLSQAQAEAVRQALGNEVTEQAPGFDAKVGSKAPDNVTTHTLPITVTAQVPQAKSHLFVKLPDEILLIDPANKEVAEIIPLSSTTGSGAGGASPMSPQGPLSPGTPSQQGR